jgi:hypothetical protein
MVDPFGQVVRECAYKPRPTQKSIALTYAFGLRQDVFPRIALGGGTLDVPGVGRANEAIIAAFGAKAHDKIKALAWAYAMGEKQP